MSNRRHRFVLAAFVATAIAGCSAPDTPATSDAAADSAIEIDSGTADVASSDNPDPPLTAPPVTVPHTVAVGDDHGCAVTPGGVKCFGNDNFNGELGPENFRSSMKLAPQLVAGTSDAVEVATGDGHTCVRHNDGTVSCFGINSRGELGAPSSDTCGEQKCRATPVKVVGLSSVVRVVARFLTTCALLGDGTVRCFGARFTPTDGVDSGDGTEEPRTLPFAERLVDIVFANNELCGITTAGTVRCFNDATSARPKPWTTGEPPTVVTGVNGFTASATTGRALLLGDKLAFDRGSVAGFPPVAQLAGAHDGWFQCARLTSGAVRCWGDASTVGTGRPLTPKTITPAEAKDISGVVATDVAGARDWGCARTASGLRCWGRNAPLSSGSALWDGYPVDVPL